MQVLDRSTDPQMPKRGHRARWIRRLTTAVVSKDITQVKTLIADVLGGDDF